jgi:eukaryotic-like serine/threonine-protein kinase
MAPEQCLPGQRGVVGAPADVYGLGVTLYRAICGDLPFSDWPSGDETDPLVKYPQLTNDPTPLPDNIPERVAEPVMACLDPDPSGRPSAAELSAEFEELVSLLPKARPLGRKRPRL